MDNVWWGEEYGFFGDFYMTGDDSLDGYLTSKKQSLKDRTDEEVNGVLSLLSVDEGARILDCPCGYGRHSIELSRRGYRVVGSDVNSKHLNLAKNTADKESLDVTFVKESMLDLEYSEEFDAVINMFYSPTIPRGVSPGMNGVAVASVPYPLYNRR